MSVVKKDEVSLYRCGMGRATREFRFLTRRGSVSGTFVCALPEAIAVKLGQTKVEADTLAGCAEQWNAAIQRFLHSRPSKRTPVVKLEYDQVDHAEGDDGCRVQQFELKVTRYDRIRYPGAAEDMLIVLDGSEKGTMRDVWDGEKILEPDEPLQTDLTQLQVEIETALRRWKIRLDQLVKDRRARAKAAKRARAAAPTP